MRTTLIAILVGVCAMSLWVSSCAQSTTGANTQPDLSMPPADMTVVKEPKPDMAKTPPDLIGADFSMPDAPPPPDLAGQMLVGADTCGNAPSMSPGVLYSGQDTTGKMNDEDFDPWLGTNSRCDEIKDYVPYPAPDVFYRVSVPPNNTLKVTLANEAGSTADLAIALVTNCGLASFTCVAAKDGLSGTEIAHWYNSGTSNSEIWIIVDGYQASEFGKYTIKAELLAGAADLGGT